MLTGMTLPLPNNHCLGQILGLAWSNSDGTSSILNVYDIEKIVFNDTEILLKMVSL